MVHNGAEFRDARLKVCGRAIATMREVGQIPDDELDEAALFALVGNEGSYDMDDLAVAMADLRTLRDLCICWTWILLGGKTPVVRDGRIADSKKSALVEATLAADPTMTPQRVWDEAPLGMFRTAVAGEGQGG